jgi:paired amphipathic helix protein Sin3a
MAEEAVPTSNLRGEPVGLPSSTPSRDVKMPPLGQFNVKDSGKENKKRRGGPGVGLSSVSGPSGVDAARMPEARGGPPAGSFTNGNKVSSTFTSRHGEDVTDRLGVMPCLLSLPPLFRTPRSVR